MARFRQTHDQPDRGWTPKHLLHGVAFLLTGLLMLGSYIVVGEPDSGEVSLRWGVVAALVMIGWAILVLLPGRRFLEHRNPLVEYYDAMVVAVAVALAVRTFMIEPFKIPSGSMIPTLLVGDYLFVNKMAYGHRAPFMKTRLFQGEGPRRGDVVVFEYPRDPGKDYIKRVVGLPGDRILYEGHRLYINNVPVQYQGREGYSYHNERNQKIESDRYLERLPDAVEYSVLWQRDGLSSMRTDEVVPEGHYFVMGDNRDNSNDSRFWGFVPGHRLVGKAVVLFWSWDMQQGAVRWDRLWKAIQ
ncbi:MAG: signal peptidase I [Magnetococcales bacterium]|nr:signal peptidase I [Magnetococcales bacterium]